MTRGESDPCRVLVTEPDHLVRTALRLSLRQAGYEVEGRVEDVAFTVSCQHRVAVARLLHEIDRLRGVFNAPATASGDEPAGAPPPGVQD